MEEKKKTTSKVATGNISPGKLVKASINILTDPTQTGLLFTNDVDRMEIPKEYHKLIKTCRFFYKRDPIAGTVLNKMVDCAITPLSNKKSECTDDEYEVYNALTEICLLYTSPSPRD